MWKSEQENSNDNSYITATARLSLALGDYNIYLELDSHL